MPHQKCPLWVTIIIILCSLPVFGLPSLLAAAPAGGELKMLIWFYPAYVVVSAICAWLCYPSRKAITWILLILMILSHVSIYMLVFSGIPVATL